MDLNGIAQRLHVLGLGEIGRTLFVHYMPDGVARGTLVQGRLTGTQIDRYIPGMRRGGFQIVVRHDTHPEGMALAQSIMHALTLHHESIESVFYYYIQPRHEPVPYPLSKGDNLEISVNFDVAFHYL